MSGAHNPAVVGSTPASATTGRVDQNQIAV
ncbi:uncharacterized protein METZ01_LOCUS93101 [marine metagenome]|uniref:Uncharacterized protein n=1 Tax=marine metagenome TaxID=408172 RepID=A0A381VKR5_9ZZZZ